MAVQEQERWREVGGEIERLAKDRSTKQSPEISEAALSPAGFVDQASPGSNSHIYRVVGKPLGSTTGF